MAGYVQNLSIKPAATMHAPDHVTGALGIKNNYTFGIPILYLSIHCATFIGLQRRLRRIYILDFYHRASLIHYLSLWPWPFDIGQWSHMV